jgi:alpha-beta hydrolase superfamily lysophospholipase
MGRSKKLVRFVFITCAGLIAAVLTALAVMVVVFSVQSAQGSLHPLRRVPARPPEEAGAPAYQEVTFETSDGILLSGWYAAPRAGQTRVIILAHGYAGNRTMLLPQAAVLVRAGFGVLLFDFRAHGASAGAQVTFGDRERLDVRAAVDFALAQPGVTSAAGLGFSMGAAALAGAAAADPRLQAVVLEAAFPDLEAEMNYQARLAGILSQLPTRLVLQQAGVRIAEVSPLRDLCAIQPRPVLLVYGGKDTFIPPGAVGRMQAAACASTSLWLLPQAGHESAAVSDPAEFARRVVLFLGQ